MRVVSWSLWRLRRAVGAALASARSRELGPHSKSGRCVPVGGVVSCFFCCVGWCYLCEQTRVQSIHLLEKHIAYELTAQENTEGQNHAVSVHTQETRATPTDTKKVIQKTHGSSARVSEVYPYNPAIQHRNHHQKLGHTLSAQITCCACLDWTLGENRIF